MEPWNKNDGDETKDDRVIDDNGRKRWDPERSPEAHHIEKQLRSYVPCSHKKKKLKLSCLTWKLIILHLSDQGNSCVRT